MEEMELNFDRVRFCGRRSELSQIKKAFRQVHCEGTNNGDNEDNQSSGSERNTVSVVLIEGLGGTGKSSLAEEFLGGIRNETDSCDDRDGSFKRSNKKIVIGRGKFDEISSVPMSTISECIDSLLDDASQQDPNWSNSIETRDLPDVRRVATLVPRIRMLVERVPASMSEESASMGNESEEESSVQSSGGKQLLDVNSQWGFDKVRFSVRTFFRCLCKQFTVVLLLDDLQWSGENSIKLIETLVKDKQAGGFLLIATHRPLQSGSPVARSMFGDSFSLLSSDYLTRNPMETTSVEETSSGGTARLPPTNGLRGTKISLGDLDHDSVCNVVSRLLGREVEDVSELCQITYAKTGGTVYFVIQFLRHLYENRLLFFSAVHCRWEYDAKRISAETNISANVVQLVCDKISSLPISVQIPLVTAAFLGVSKFDLALLFHVLQRSPIYPAERKESALGEAIEESKNSWICPTDLGEVAMLLEVAVKEGLLELLPRSSAAAARRYRFSHDRVWESARALAPATDDERTKMLHLQIGRGLKHIRDSATDSPVEGLDDFQAAVLSVRHLNDGSEAMTDSEERAELAKMNLEAGILVFEKSAFRPALNFFRKGLDLLDAESSWENHYELTLQLMSKLAEVQYCSGNHDANWANIDDILNHAKSPVDKIATYRIRTVTLMSQCRFDQSIRSTLVVLDELGLKLPRRLISVRTLRTALKTRKLITQQSEGDALTSSLAPSVDPVFAHQMEFLQLLFASSMLGDSFDLCLIAMLHAIPVVLEHRVEEYLPMTKAVCAAILGLLGRRDEAYRLSKLAIKIALENPNLPPEQVALTLTFASWYSVWWREPFHNTLRLFLDAYKLLVDVGGIEWIGVAIGGYFEYYFGCGLKLDPFWKDLQRFLEVLDDYDQTSYRLIYRPFAQLVFNLMGSESANNPASLLGPIFDEAGLAQIHVERNDLALYHYRRFQMKLAFLFNDLDLAAEMSAQLKSSHMYSPCGWIAHQHMYQGLIAFGLSKRLGRGPRSLWQRQRGARFSRILDRLATEGNVNCVHMAFLLNAECTSLKQERNPPVVQSAYDKAITAAARRGFLHDQAIGNELAGLYFLSRDDKFWASTYLTRAHDVFLEWGARGKAGQMVDTYGQLIGASTSASHAGTGIKAQSRFAELSGTDRKNSFAIVGFNHGK